MNKIIAFIAALCMGLAMLTITASSASAHHPLVDGEGVCNTETGLFDISWTVSSDDPNRGKEWTLNSATVSGPGSPSDNIPTGSYKSESEAYTGSTTGVGPGTYTLEVTASWKPDGPNNVTRSGSVTVSGDCEPPKEEVTAAAPHFIDECGTENDNTITASGNPEIAYNVVKDGATTTVTAYDTNPENNVVLVGQTEWSYTFTDEECPVDEPVEVTPAFTSSFDCENGFVFNAEDTKNYTVAVERNARFVTATFTIREGVNAVFAENDAYTVSAEGKVATVSVGIPVAKRCVAPPPEEPPVNNPPKDNPPKHVAVPTVVDSGL